MHWTVGHAHAGIALMAGEVARGSASSSIRSRCAITLSRMVLTAVPATFCNRSISR